MITTFIKNNSIAASSKRMITIWILLSIFLFTAAYGFAANRETREGALTPTFLSCEYAENPLNVDLAQPRLFWKVESGERDQRQTAYRLLAASTLDQLNNDCGDLWDSGKIASDETLHIPYEGALLKSSQRIFWKVRVWDKSGKPSPWSAPAFWSMGILNEADWAASWIGAPTETPETLLLRREFRVKPHLERAVAYVCGLGHYEMTLNGQKAGEDFLTPGWSKYDKTCLYDAYDITPLLKEGANAAGLFLGNGMYNVKGGRYIKFKGSFGPLKAIAQLRLEYADGTVERIGSDETWRVHAGPITFSCIYGGEDYDARLESKGWNQPGFDESQWTPAKKVPGPGGKLKGLSCSAPPVKTFETLKPISIKPLNPNTCVYDLGQNVSLIPRLKVKGSAGAVVKITPAELIHDDGSVDRGSCGGGEAYWKYTLAGGDSETWISKFFYHGCRYLQVECSAPEGGEAPAVESLEGLVFHSSSEPIGEFACSNELFNRIRTLVRWAQRSNMMHVLTDCPHRERLGWLEEYHLNGPSIRYEFDLARMFIKSMNDMSDSQLENGLVPDIAPEYVVFSGGFRDSPEWGSAYVICPWQQYEWTGDLELLREHYEGMKNYASYLGSKAKDHIVSHGLGDWCDLGPKSPGYAQLTPIPLTATAFYYYDVWILAQTAELLGYSDEAKQFEKLAEQIRQAFNKTFYHSETGQYADGSQCANSIALVMNLAEPDRRQALLDAIVKDVQNRGNALTAGDVGYRYLLRALAEGGRSDVIFDINNQSDKPGYGYQLEHGATSLVETWDARRNSSWNHFMLGHIMEWFYHDLAGIGGDPTGPGFKKILIQPQPVGDIAWARASYNSIHGLIAAEWKREDGKFTLKVAIPANTTATVSLPGAAADQVTESGAAAESRPGVKFLRYEKGRAIYAVGSGQYEFRSRL